MPPELASSSQDPDWGSEGELHPTAFTSITEVATGLSASTRPAKGLKSFTRAVSANRPRQTTAGVGCRCEHSLMCALIGMERLQSFIKILITYEECSLFLIF